MSHSLFTAPHRSNRLADLTAIILTFNEEKHIERCIRSASEVARCIFVIDSFSDDRTVAIAESFGARVRQHEFVNHAAQLDWALDNLPLNTEWVMRVDADEVITPTLAEQIRAKLPLAAKNVNGFLVCRYPTFMGTIIRHGGFPQWSLRLWRKGTAEIERRWMDEHMVLTTGESERLQGEYIDDNLNNITWWTNKHNGYATREAIDLLNRKYEFLPKLADAGKLASQARLKRWLKDHFYLHLPLGLRAFLLFFYRMSLRLGFLDGMGGGFAFHFLQGFWYRFLADVKVREVERRMHSDNVDCVEAIKRELGIDPICATENNCKSA